MKLLNIRFAYLSEPETGEKFNTALIKELTGAEEIVARALHKESKTFIMEAKFFLACNEKPIIKGEDEALWRRLRVVSFPSKFVDEPKEENEYKIDRTLPSKMREDITWRQTFLNILIDYYYRDIGEPDSVKENTKEYKEESNEFETWLNEGNIVYDPDSYITIGIVAEAFFQKKGINSSMSSKLKPKIESFIKEKYPEEEYIIREKKMNGIRFKGWKHFSVLKQF